MPKMKETSKVKVFNFCENEYLGCGDSHARISTYEVGGARLREVTASVNITHCFGLPKAKINEISRICGMNHEGIEISPELGGGYLPRPFEDE